MIIPMDTISIKPIGILHCDLQSREEAPKNYDESAHTGFIEINPRFLAGLQGIHKGDIIVVLFWLDRADRTECGNAEQSTGDHGLLQVRRGPTEARQRIQR